MKETLRKFVNKHPRIHPRRQFRAGIFSRLTWQLRQDPKFMVIGAGKSGTTSLEKYITQHPKVKPTMTKELHYFDVMFDHGFAWYRSHFPLKSSNMISGDFTPSYLDHPESPNRIYEKYPDMKFIVILRNPIDRAYSQYQHTKRNGDETLTFENAIKTEPQRIRESVESYRKYSYLIRGLYYEQLSIWFSYFPRKNFLIIEYSELSNLDELLNKIFNFLNLKPYHKMKNEKFNVGTYTQIDNKLRDKLYHYFKPHNEKLFTLLGWEFNWD